MHLKISLKMSLLRPYRAARRFLDATRGVVSVELAFIAPILGFLIVGLVDFGETINRKTQLANAVRAGTQYALVRKPVQGDLTQITQAVVNTAPPDQSGTRSITTTFYCECPDGTTISCDTTCAGEEERRSYITIALQEDYRTIFTYPGLGNPIRLYSEATVRLN